MKIFTHNIIRVCFLFFLFVIAFPNRQVYAQNPQDCIGAIAICQNVYFEQDAYQGIGDVTAEINPLKSCLASGEKNDVWYTFTVQSSGTLNFSITPNDMDDDYDWAVFNLTNNPCSDIKDIDALEVSCNYDAEAGITGPNGETGPQNEETIQVVEGETYVINVSQFSPSINGYKLDFSGSTATIFDQNPPQPIEVETPIPCGSSTIKFTMSENILCSSVDNADFLILGPGGPYAISNVQSFACGNGGSYDRYFEATVTPPINASGQFEMILPGQVIDLCGNANIPYKDTLKFISTTTPFTGIVNDVSICQGGGGGSTITIQGGAGIYNFYLNTVSPQNLVASGVNYDPSATIKTDTTYYFLITQIVNGCESSPDTITYTIGSAQSAEFNIPAQMCVYPNSTNLTAQLLPTSTPGGVFVINPPTATLNPSTGELILSTVVPNTTYDITYATSGLCQDVITHSITFVQADPAAISGLNPEYCLTDPAADLTLAPTGGSLTGTGLNATNQFEPQLAGVGAHTLTYTYTNPNGCTDTATIQTTVNPNTTSEFTANPTQIPIGGNTTITFTGTLVPNATYMWDFDGAEMVSGQNEGPYTIKWTTPGNKQISLYVSTSGGCNADTSYATVIVSQSMLIPNAFSPNGDGVNDIFKINSVPADISKSSMLLFNRWGQKVYQTNSIAAEGWDGVFNDQLAPIGTYVYFITTTDTQGKEKTYKGNLTLIR